MTSGASNRTGFLAWAACAVWFAAGTTVPGASNEVTVLKSTHFIVEYPGSDSTFAEQAARVAEASYERTGNDLGLERRHGFWLWEKRVRIVVHPGRDAFVQATGAPAWAAGLCRADRREIITFQGSTNFVERVLPHEVAHLVFREFTGFERDPPLWLGEGIAEWVSHRDRADLQAKVREHLRAGRLRTLAALTAVKVADLEADPALAAVFYVQSAHLVGWLIRSHGNERFRKFCGQIRDGKAVEPALAFTYPESFRTMSDLEGAWKRSLEAEP